MPKTAGIFGKGKDIAEVIFRNVKMFSELINSTVRKLEDGQTHTSILPMPAFDSVFSKHGHDRWEFRRRKIAPDNPFDIAIADLGDRLIHITSSG